MLTFLGGEFVKMHVVPEFSAHFVPNPWEEKNGQTKNGEPNNQIFVCGQAIFKDPWDVL